jgi:hypothetical protein
VRNHARAVLACDLFVTVTATFRVLHIFVVLDRGLSASVAVECKAHVQELPKRNELGVPYCASAEWVERTEAAVASLRTATPW